MAPFSQRAERAGSDSMKWRKYADSDVLPMWLADMDFPAADPILDAIRARVDHGVFGYSLPDRELLEVACSYLQRRWDWKVDPEWITVSPGLGVALHTVCRMAGMETGGILTPRPIYTAFRNAPAWAGRKRIDVDFRLDRENNVWLLDDPAQAASEAGGADVLMLCNPHNPNGKVFSRQELEKLAEAAAANDWIICSDEVHADLIVDDCRHIPIASLAPETGRRTITLQSPSKAFNLPGLNFGIVVIEDERLRNRYRQAARGQVIDQLNPLGMAAARAAWDGSCDEWLRQLIVHIHDRREQVYDTVVELDGRIRMPHLISTYLAWLDISALKLEDPHDHFLGHGLGISPGSRYGDPSFMRLNFGTDTETVAEGCRRMAAAVQALTA